MAGRGITPERWPRGEPAGLWYGQGAADLGLSGEVDADLLRGIYSSLLDPRDPATHDPARWGDAATLAAGPRNYRSVDERYRDLLAAETHAEPERRAELPRDRTRWVGAGGLGPARCVALI